MTEVIVMTSTVPEITIKRKIDMAINETQQRIATCEQSDKLRFNNNAFTRERRLGAKNILQLILHRIYRSLQLTLEKYFDEIGRTSVSKQAFSQGRMLLNPEYVRTFADMTSRLAAEDQALQSYNGMRLIAFDGSDVALENTPELKETFGCSGPKKDAATALVSIAFGPLDQMIYDCRIDQYDTDERTLAKAHVLRLMELGLGGSLLLHDRWYPSAEYVAFLYETGFHFVMRVRSKFNLEADAIKTQSWIRLKHEGKEYPVRVLKVTLNTGETETLFTSLDQKQLPLEKAGALYFERWKVETAYDQLKSKLELENFSGKTKTSVLQDFYATIYLANMIAFADEEADKRIAETDRDKELKYVRKANRSRSIFKFRDIFLRLIMEPDESKRTAMLDKLIEDIIRYPVPIVPDRSPIRKQPRKKRFYQTRRSVV